MNSFSAKQTAILRGKLDANRIRARDANGMSLSYLEGWYVISEANRIFGFDGWGRETVDVRCVWQGREGGQASCCYAVRVRVTVLAGDRNIVREGTGAGHGRAETMGDAHTSAIKEAETDATKRALCTFGNRFGLALYDPQQRGVRKQRKVPRPLREQAKGHESLPTEPVMIDGATPTRAADDLSRIAPMLVRPVRRRDREHLQFVGQQPCLVCGRTPSHAHHVTFLQGRGLGQKVSDEYTVPLCAIHHRALHDAGREVEWWASVNIDPAPVALGLWRASQRIPVEDEIVAGGQAAGMAGAPDAGRAN